MLAFINHLNVQRPAQPEPEVIDATVWNPHPDQPSLPGLDQPIFDPFAAPPRRVPMPSDPLDRTLQWSTVWNGL
jgi:hypothetical protein